MKTNALLSALLIFAGLFFCSCNGKEKTGKVALQFKFNVDDEELIFHDKTYLNAAGTLYQVDELKFFISEVVFYHKEGKTIHIIDHNGIHYADNAIQSTLLWNIKDLLTVGEYNAVAFTFGLSHDDNVDGKFVNAPESNMAWSPELGGGYHYMQL
ncbi:MAG: hypothetical protein LBU51_02010, partial [Bacteroidales bacterium]|nr:hypothetical protein [Bacteroidales bacterium]